MHGEETNGGSFEDKKEELQEFLKKRIKNRNAKILVYDADWSSGKSPGSVLALLKSPESFGFDRKN